MQRPNRSHNPDDYRFGFQGQEHDGEFKGSRNSVSFKYRVHDPRLGRFLSIDPMTGLFPMLTPYQFASNTPIQSIDLDGLEGVKVVDAQTRTTTIIVNINYVPKTHENKKGYNSGFTEEEVNQIKKGIQNQLSKSDFYDWENIDPIYGPYKVKFEINFVSHETRKSVKTAVFKNREDIYDTNIELTKGKRTTVKLPDGSTGVKEGGTRWKKMELMGTDGHTATHELFHSFSHVHLAAPQEIATAIDPKDPEPGHFDEGGIFVYENRVKGITLQDLNQQNVDGALKSLPTIEKRKRR